MAIARGRRVVSLPTAQKISSTPPKKGKLEPLTSVSRGDAMYQPAWDKKKDELHADPPPPCPKRGLSGMTRCDDKARRSKRRKKTDSRRHFVSQLGGQNTAHRLV